MDIFEAEIILIGGTRYFNVDGFLLAFERKGYKNILAMQKKTLAWQKCVPLVVD